MITWVFVSDLALRESSLETFKALRRDMSATDIEFDQALQRSKIIDRCIGDK